MNQLRSALTPMRAWLLALVLLAAQSAGLAHRINHAVQQGSAKITAQQSARGIIDHQAGSADCRLVDQLTHADALCAGFTAGLPTPLPQAPAVALPARTLLAAPAALYRARAPPRG